MAKGQKASKVKPIKGAAVLAEYVSWLDRQPLVANACILSNTIYLQDAIDDERAEGRSIQEDTVAHLSPARFEKINPYGQYRFDIAEVIERQRHQLDNP